MRILIVAHFTRDFSPTDNGRFLYLAKKLAKEHEVEIVTSNFRHGTKGKKPPIGNTYPFKITMLDEPAYKKNVGLKRFYSHYVWGRNLGKYLRTIARPDVVYCAVPSLTGPKCVAEFCEANGIRLVIDVQDLWPEAFRMVFRIPGLSSLLFAPFRKLADAIYSRADAICAVSQTYVDRALEVNRKCNCGTAVFLGTELKDFDEFASHDAPLEKHSGEIWLAYCGTLGSSYDLHCVFDALDLLKTKGILLKFVVMGNGPMLREFETYSKAKGVDAVFTGRLPYDEMCALLCKCDIAINPISHMAPQSIINKHGDYAASGLPVVSTQESDEYRKLVEQYGMGFNCRNNDPQDLADKLECLALDETLRRKMGANARRCAQEKFDRKTSYQHLISEIIAR